MSSSMSLAATTFASGADDKLATADVYSISNEEPINSVQDPVDSNVLKNAESLRKAGGEAFQKALKEKEKLSSLITNAGNTTAIDKAALGRLSNISSELNPGLSSNLRNISGTTLSTISENISNLDLITSPSVSIGGITSKISTEDISTISNLGSLINEVGCDALGFLMNDLSALSGLYSGIINMANKLGIPNIFGQMMSCRTDKNLINQVGNNSFKGISNSSDVGSLTSLGQLTSPGSVRMCNPDLVDNFSSNYKYSNGSTNANESKRMDSLFSAYDTLDPNWNTTTRRMPTGNTNIYSIAKMTGSSNNLKTSITNKVLSDVVGKNSLLSLVNVYGKTNVNSQVSRNFTNTNLMYNRSGLNNNTVSPISLLKNLI